MKLSELKNEDAIEALADLIGPIAELGQDPEVVEAIKGSDKLGTIRLVLKKHAKTILNIMAITEGVAPEEYECNIITLPAKLLELLNMPEFSFLFPSQGQKGELNSSGSAMATTEDGEN